MNFDRYDAAAVGALAAGVALFAFVVIPHIKAAFTAFNLLFGGF